MAQHVHRLYHLSFSPPIDRNPAGTYGVLRAEPGYARRFTYHPLTALPVVRIKYIKKMGLFRIFYAVELGLGVLSWRVYACDNRASVLLLLE